MLQPFRLPHCTPMILKALCLVWSIAVFLPAMSCAQAQVSTSGAVRNGLAPTSMDSFVYEAGQYSELIYGDEGSTGAPPYELFTVSHRINTGILGTRDQGLTTGHGSYMPSAWGADEFVGNEWSNSGPQGVSNASGLYAGGSYLTPDNATPAAATPGNASDYASLPDDNNSAGEAEGAPTPVSWNQELAAQGSNEQWIAQPNGNYVNNITGITYLPNGTQVYIPSTNNQGGTGGQTSQDSQALLNSNYSGF